MNMLKRSSLSNIIKSGSGDTSYTANDVTSATASVICPTTSGTTKYIDTYVYGIGDIL